MQNMEADCPGSTVFCGSGEIRRIQLLAVLMSCLPKDGKCRELFEMALRLDETGPLARLRPPGDPDVERGLQPWLESLWANIDMGSDERDLVWWQNSSENMAAAIAELKAVEERLGGVRFVSSPLGEMT